MSTANERIRDALVRRQIRLIRVAEGLSNRLLRMLAKTDRDIQQDLTARLQSMAADRVTFGSTTTERLRRMQAGLRRITDPTFADMRSALRSELLQLAVMEAGYVATTITGALPVIVSLELPTLAAIRSAVLTRPFEGHVLREWIGRIEAGDRRRITEAVRIGLLRGETADQVTRRVVGSARLQRKDGVRELTRQGVRSLVHTALNHATNQASQELYRVNKALISEELYLATLDSRTTPVCRAFDGQRFPTGTGPIPPLHFNCRSRRVPIVNGALAGTRPANATTAKLLEGTRGAERKALVKQLVGEVPAQQNYSQFLKAQTKDFQEEVLGVTKARLFRQGGLPLEKFINTAGKELTLDQLRRLEPDAFKRAGLQ